MQSTPYAEVNALLDHLLAGVREALGDELIGIYLYGSLVTGDFDAAVSDIDLLAVTASDVDDRRFRALKEMHDALVSEFPAWDDRVEVAYLSAAALKTFRTQPSQIVVISPGEPLNVKNAGIDWLMNWYVVRERGVGLYGPPAAGIIGPIAREEFIESVRDYARWCARRMEDKRTRGAQAYAILTLCRALYAVRTGELASKVRAAGWVQTALPEWAPVIADALAWREVQWEAVVDRAATFERTVDFVRFVSELMTD